MNAGLVAVILGDARREGGALVLPPSALHRECF
jgi:hypothetical protein